VLPNPFDDRPARIKTKIAITYAFLIAANIAAWAWAFAAFGERPVLLGTASLAYMFGVRHALDADHIAAIDNAVRKLMQDERSPYSVGLFFSFGHSTFVVLASTIIAAGAVAQNNLGPLQNAGEVIGTGVSAAFLLIIGIANLFILKSTWSAFSRARNGEAITGADLNALDGGGLLARVFRPVFRIVSRSWHMFPIGFLFGLGFDTATEIGLLGMSASQVGQGLPFWTILVFPALFTAGMSLVDTTDSVLMTGVYGWAFVEPQRKLWYNLTITAASVITAVFIGGVEVLGLIGGELGLQGGLWSVIGGLNGDPAALGLAIVGIFAASWAVSTWIYRAGGFDTLRSAPLEPAGLK
jgi:high-affinity nickel-transport protein